MNADEPPRARPAISLGDVEQLLKSQRGFVSEHLKRSKSGIERTPWFAALKILSVIESATRQFAVTTCPPATATPRQSEIPSSIEDLGARLIQQADLPPELPFTCFQDPEWRADLARYLPAKARAIEVVGRLAGDGELARYILDALRLGPTNGRKAGPEQIPAPSAPTVPVTPAAFAMPAAPVSPVSPANLAPPPALVVSEEEPPLAFPASLVAALGVPRSVDKSGRISVGGASYPLGQKYASEKVLVYLVDDHFGAYSPNRQLIRVFSLKKPNSVPKVGNRCPHCGGSFKKPSAMISHAKACGQVKSEGENLRRVNADGSIPMFNQKRRLGRQYAGRQVRVAVTGTTVSVVDERGKVIATYEKGANGALVSSKVCPHCGRAFGNAGAMKSHAKFCRRVPDPDWLVKIARETLPMPETVAHVNVTAHKVAASDRPWDGEQFKQVGDAEHFAEEVYDEKFIHHSRKRQDAHARQSTIAERVVADNASKKPK